MAKLLFAWTVLVTFCSFAWYGCTAQQQTPSSSVMFCASVLDLAVGDSFNIRDVVVDRQDPSREIDWSQVTFDYKRNDTTSSLWHLEEFKAGINVNLTDNDLTADAAYKIYVRGSTPGESSCSIRVWSAASQLPDVLRDGLCGAARGYALSVPGGKDPLPTDNIPGSSMLRFCVYSIQLTIGDVFNIRDAVVYQSSSVKLIDWTKVVFYYSDRENWRIDEFSRGKPFMIRESDFGRGNRGSNEFRVSMRDLLDTDDQLTIRLTRNASASTMRSFMSNPNCGYFRRTQPFNNIQRSYPLIVTTVFDYDGPILSYPMSVYVASLLQIPVQWIQDCPQKVVNTECIQFVDIPVEGVSPSTEVWADRFLQSVNYPSINDTFAKDWTSFSKANITGSSALNNIQPLTFDAGPEPPQDLSNPVYNGLLIMGIAFILIMAAIVAFVYYRRAKERTQRS